MESQANRPLVELTAFRKRQKPPLSKAKLAREIGTSRLNVHRWETGERAPEIEMVPAISAKTLIPPEKIRPDVAGLFALARKLRREALKRRKARGNSRAA